MANDKPTKPQPELSEGDLDAVSGGTQPPEPVRTSKTGLAQPPAPIKPFLIDPPEPEKIGH